MWSRPLYTHPIRGSMSKPSASLKNLLIGDTHTGGITHLQLARPPVNSLNFELLKELNQWLLYLGSNEETKAVVISSASPGIFTGGLDLKELNRPTKEDFRRFWHEVQEMWLIVSTLPKPSVAAINGTCMAGGCVLAMPCDYRVMAKQKANSPANGRQFTIGLNEAKLGLVAPPFVAANYTFLTGTRTAEKLLVTGDTPTAEEALKIGLVDKVTPDEKSCVEEAFKEAEKLLTISPYSHTTSRDIARRAVLETLAGEGQRENDMRAMHDLVFSESVQTILDGYVAALKQKSKK